MPTNITMESFMDTFVDAGTKQTAREALDIWLTQSSSANGLTISGAGALTISTGAYTVTVPATGTMVLADSTATLTNKTFDTAGTGNSFSINGLAATANTGTGAVVRATSPTLVTPALGVATCTTINGVTLSNAGTLDLNGSTISFPSGGDLDILATGGTSCTLVTGTVATLAGVETLTNKVLTSATITTALTPTTDDGAALGSTGNKFSDLFLASGAVLNFNAGDVTFTHSANVVTVAGGDLRVTTAGTDSTSTVTVGGTQTLTNKTLTSPTINSATIDNPTIESGGSWAGTPTFFGGLDSESDISVLGSVTVDTDAGKIGYGTGAGGSVASGSVTGSSPNWAATLNKPVGQITIPALTTAGGSEELLVVTNTTVAAQDIIVVGTTYTGAGLPVLSVKAIGSSTFTVVVSNVDSSAFNATMTINFCVIKGVVA